MILVHLEQREQVLILILQNIPLLYERRHQHLNVLRFVEVVPHGVGQRADGVVQDEQVLVLVLGEGEHQGLEDVAEIGHQFCAGLLLQGGEGGAGCFLYTLVAVQDALQKLKNTK